VNLKAQLKQYLVHLGLTASQLSRKAGVPDATISDWLAGRKPRNLDQVRKVAAALGTTIDHLVYGDGIAKPEADINLEDLLGDKWIGGTFELKIRRVKK
jgi:transcriptional regulator with XRE-family HTH domain